MVRAGIGLWRGKPPAVDEDADLPPIGYAEIPGEIDASQYDPARFEARVEQIPDEGTPMPPRDSLQKRLFWTWKTHEKQPSKLATTPSAI